MWPLYLNIIYYSACISHYYINVLASLTAVWTSWSQELHSIGWIGISAYSAYRVNACSIHSLGCPGWSLEQRAPFPHRHLQKSIKFFTCLAPSSVPGSHPNSHGWVAGRIQHRWVCRIQTNGKKMWWKIHSSTLLEITVLWSWKWAFCLFPGRFPIQHRAVGEAGWEPVGQC